MGILDKIIGAIGGGRKSYVTVANGNGNQGANQGRPPTVQELIERNRLMSQVQRNVRKEDIKQNILGIRRFGMAPTRMIRKPTVIQQRQLRFGGKKYFVGGVSYRPRAASGKTARGRKTVEGVKPQSGPGRPKATFKQRINPFTGKPIAIPATEYYKLVKRYNELQKAQSTNLAQQVDTQQVRQLARRGIPPEQAKQIVDMRQLQSVMQPRQPMTRIMPMQRQFPIQPQRNFRVVTDIMTGRPIAERILPRERWLE